MIGAFTFNTNQRIVFENGSAAKLADHAAPFLGERPFLVTDPGIVSLGLQEDCEACLKGSGRILARYTDVPGELEQHLAARTPQWAARITGLEADDHHVVENHAHAIPSHPGGSGEP